MILISISYEDRMKFKFNICNLYLPLFFYLFLLAPFEAQAANPDVIKKIFTPKSAMECLYSFTILQAFIENQEKISPTENGKSAISETEKSIQKYKNYLTIFTNNEDKTVISDTFKSLKSDKAKSANLLHHKTVMDNCMKLDEELTALELVNSQFPDSDILDLVGGGGNTKSKTNKPLNQEETKHANLTLSARKSPWSSFKPFFEFRKTDSGLTDKIYYYDHQMYYDAKSVIKKDNLRKVLTYEAGQDMEIGPLLGDRTKYYNVVLYELNCKDETYRTFGEIHVLHPIQKEKILRIASKGINDWTYFERNTEVAKLYQILCE